MFHCTEAVTDDEGFYVPCDAPASAWRMDVEYGEPYPVCADHSAAPLVEAPQ